MTGSLKGGSKAWEGLQGAKVGERKGGGNRLTTVPYLQLEKSHPVKSGSLSGTISFLLG